MNEPKRCWVKGAGPIVLCQTIRECTYAYAAVNPFNGDMISLVLPYTNTKIMNIFLEEVSIRQADRFTLMFLEQIRRPPGQCPQACRGQVGIQLKALMSRQTYGLSIYPRILLNLIPQSIYGMSLGKSISTTLLLMEYLL